MTLALILLLGGTFAGSEAWAAASYRSSGKKKLRELSHRVEIDMERELTTVIERSRIANLNGSDLLAVYTFDLPRAAAIADVRVGETGSTFSIVASASKTLADSARDPDLGWLRVVAHKGEGSRAMTSYELRLFPVRARKSLPFSITYTMPTELGAGQFRLRLPSRGRHDTLTASEVTIRAPGARQAFADGKTHAFSGGSVLVHPSGRHDLLVQVPFRGLGKPVAEVATLPLSPNSGVYAVRVSHDGPPSTAKRDFSRVLFVVDKSTSLGAEGTGATVQVADALLSQTAETTLFRAVEFSRQASWISNDWQPNTKSNRGELVRSLRAGGRANGSNLRAALELAGKELEGSPKRRPRTDRTLVVIVTDRFLPSTLDEGALADLLHVDSPAVTVLAVELVPADAPLPPVDADPLGILAERSGGRLVYLRNSEAEERGRQLLGELRTPPILRDVEIQIGDTVVSGPRLEDIRAGSSAFSFGYYSDGKPALPVLRGKVGTRTTTIGTRKLGGNAKAWLRTAVVMAGKDGFPGREKSEESSFLRMSTKLAALNQWTGGVLTASKSEFAKDRLRLADRWGPAFFIRSISQDEDEFSGFPVFNSTEARRIDVESKTGELDEAAISSRVRAHVIPRARGCYDQLILRDRSAGGALLLHLEVARGEVHDVIVKNLPPSLEPIKDCIVDAAYGMPIPRVRIGDDPESLVIARYPLRFRFRDDKKRTRVEDGAPASKELEERDPLFGLPD